MDDDEALIAEILSALEIEHQYVGLDEGADDDASCRSANAAGRRAGGQATESAPSPPDPAEREDQRRIVCVAVVASNEHDERRLPDRSEMLVRESCKGRSADHLAGAPPVTFPPGSPHLAGSSRHPPDHRRRVRRPRRRHRSHRRMTPPNDTEATMTTP